jgi:hypothetical protein
MFVVLSSSIAKQADTLTSFLYVLAPAISKLCKVAAESLKMKFPWKA